MNDMTIGDLIPTQPGVTAKGLWPRFYLRPKTISKPVRDERGVQMRDPDSDEPMWAAQEIVEEWVEITIVGDKQSVVCKKADPAVQAQFPDHYRSWKDGASGVVGTPIEQLPGMDERKVHEFKAANIYTIEGLAELSDAQIGKAGLGGRHLVIRAQNFLADRKGPGLEAQVKALTEERDETRAQMAKLEGQMAELIGFLKQQTPTESRKSKRDDVVREGAEP